MALALTVPGASVAATPRIPIFNVGSDAHLLGGSDYLYFDAYNLDAAPSPERMTISIPHAHEAVQEEFFVTWKSGVKPVLLVRDDQIKALAKQGKLTLRDAHIVLNAPIFKVGK